MEVTDQHAKSLAVQNERMDNELSKFQADNERIFATLDRREKVLQIQESNYMSLGKTADAIAKTSVFRSISPHRRVVTAGAPLLSKLV